MHKVWLAKLESGTPESGVWNSVVVIATYEDIETAASLCDRLNACPHLTADGYRHFIG